MTIWACLVVVNHSALSTSRHSVLFLQAFQLRQLCSPHPAKALSPIVVRGIADADATTRRHYIGARRQLQLDLTQQLQDVFV